ncbi:hypothetical protein ACIP96_06480 [Streptomyces nigra]|uniref:hypothetical protein n=1 Tax=Streptomyces nigra TaxID=1827580 RepID=UPI0037FF2434
MRDVDQHAEAHRLKAEHNYGARRIAAELGITRHAATQLLARPLADQPAAVAAPVAEAAGVAERPSRPVAVPALPVAVRVASHLDAIVGQAPATPRRLVIDLEKYPGLAEDLALLEKTGAAAADVVDFAVDRLAAAYRTARSQGLLRDGQAFDVTRLWLRPAGRRSA